MSDASIDPTSTVVVFTSGDPVELISAKLLLEGEAIPFATAGEGVQELFGMGRFNLLTGPARILVRGEDAERAESVLAALREA